MINRYKSFTQLNTNFAYFTQKDTGDITDELSAEDKAELISLASEPFGNKTISQKEFDEAIREWRTR